MTPAQADIVKSVREAFGEKAVIIDRDAITPWLTDWRGRWTGDTPAILAPSSTEQVAAMVGWARDHGVPLVPQGGNTSMVGGATPPVDGSALILSLRRMNQVRSMDPGAGFAVAEAGVILADFHAVAEAAGRRFPLTLGARGSATIGGLVSTNAGGTQVLRWGTMRGLVAGVEAVLPDGQIHDGLVALKKDNRGYDINQLLIGAEGTLGIVTAATLRLAPAIAQRGVAWVATESPHKALDLLRTIEARTDTVESFEIIPGDTLALAVAHLGTQPPLTGEHRWHVLIEAVSGDPEAEAPAAILEQLLGGALDAGLITDGTIAASEAQAGAFWRLRDTLSEAERGTGPAAQHDISVPVSGMPDFMIDGARAVEASFPGTHATAFGHLGDGNVHFHVRAPRGMAADAWYGDLAEHVTAFVHDLVVAAGGSISAEHGIGQMKLAELARLGPASRLAALGAIKSGLDPEWLFNPGKLVPLASRPDAS